MRHGRAVPARSRDIVLLSHRQILRTDEAFGGGGGRCNGLEYQSGRCNGPARAGSEPDAAIARAARSHARGRNDRADTRTAEESSHRCRGGYYKSPDSGRADEKPMMP